jgi:hypothetical protein
MNMKQALALGVMTFLLSLPIVASAQWDRKPYTQWTERESQKLLNDSPWAKTMVFTTPGSLFRSPTSGRQGAGGGATSQNSDQSTHVNFRVRFLSAKPVRQAISRMMELSKKLEMRAELAEHLKALASGDFTEFIVVTVSCDSEKPGSNFSEAVGLLNTRGTGHLKNNTFLETKGGKRIFLQEYQQPRPDGLGARFIFPRHVEGKEHITPSSEEIRFFTELSSNYRIDRRYKTKDMMFDGKFEY